MSTSWEAESQQRLDQAATMLKEAQAVLGAALPNMESAAPAVDLVLQKKANIYKGLYYAQLAVTYRQAMGQA